MNARERGFSGDQLFAEVYDWAAGGVKDQVRVASGLCILANLFLLCEVFEK